MPTSNYVGTLKINELTTVQYNAAVQSDIISDDDLSFLTDALDEQQTTMPTAEAKYEGQIVQFVGTTDASYTNGYFYKCVSDGQNPATYSWENIAVQEADALPSQTGQSGKFLTTNGTDASWSDKVVISGTSIKIITGTSGSYGTLQIGTGNSSTVSSYGTIGIGDFSQASNTFSIAIGSSTKSTGVNSIAVGGSKRSTGTNSVGIGGDAQGNYTIGLGGDAQGDYAIQIGAGRNINAGTMRVAIGAASQGKNYELLSADGTIPTARFTTDPVSDGAYIPTVTLNSGVATRSWETPTTVTFRTWGANE